MIESTVVENMQIINVVLILIIIYWLVLLIGSVFKINKPIGRRGILILIISFVIVSGYTVWSFLYQINGRTPGKIGSYQELLDIVNNFKPGIDTREVEKVTNYYHIYPDSKVPGLEEAAVNPVDYVGKVNYTWKYKRGIACTIYLHFDHENKYLGFSTSCSP